MITDEGRYLKIFSVTDLLRVSGILFTAILIANHLIDTENQTGMLDFPIKYKAYQGAGST
jgi:hypothetical protein